MDGRGGFSMELLVDDALDEGFERGLRAGDAEGEWTGALNEFAELRIGSGEFVDGERGVVARGAWARERTRHEKTV